MENPEQLMLLILISFILVGCGSPNTSSVPPVPTTVYEAEITNNALYAEFKRIAGNEVYFAFDSFVLSKTSKATLTRQVAWLKANPSTMSDIEGHCDEIGTNEYNIRLGLKRAQSVKNFLEQLGVDKERLSVTSYGKTKANKYEHTKYAHRADRRAVTVIIK
jgi:peptidoglycan-associated lipoprotein